MTDDLGAHLSFFLFQLRTVEAAGAAGGLVFANALEPPHAYKETLVVSIMLWSCLNIQTCKVHGHFTAHTELHAEHLNT